MNLDFINTFTNESNLDEESINYHIRIRQRNGRKCWTYVENLEHLNDTDDEKFMEKLNKEFKKRFSCNGNIKDDVVQLQGDHRDGVKDILVRKFKVKEKNIKIHGF